MFLMNTFPLVALRRNWEPFAQPQGCRYPVCFSESEEDLARTAVSAQVQMIINDLQSEEVSMGSSLEYGCLIQKRRKGGKGRGHQSRQSGQVLQGEVRHALRNCPADSDGMEVEEFGPLSLNSDSDDSVDRDIEEAIQEYLRNKAQNIHPLPSNPKSLPGKDEVKLLQQEHPSCGISSHIFPSGCSRANLVPQNTSDCIGTCLTQWTSSPCNVGCNDSFEQGIKAEIEQLLNKKKPQARNKIPGRNKRCYRSEFQETLAVRQKGGAKRAGCTPLKQGRKVHLECPNLQMISVPQCLKSETMEELAGSNTESQVDFTAPAISCASVLEQSKGGGKRQMFCKGGGEPRLEDIDLSDSSSDDGIEEAIQLYQLEKNKQAAISRAGCIFWPKEEFSTGRAEVGFRGQTVCSGNGTLPEIARKSLKNKNEASAKPLVSDRTNVMRNDLGEPRGPCPPEESFAKCNLMLQASCRADSAAELMCAEAILDISKTILPPPTASRVSPFPSHPAFSSQTPMPPQDESDHDTVDSDDSIEQEIRAFLAVKAKAEPSISKSSRNLSHPGQGPSLREANEQIRSCKKISPKRLNLKQKSKVVAQHQDAQMISEYVDRSLAKASTIQVGSPESILDDKDAGKPLTAGYPLSFASPPPHGLCGSGSSAKSITREQQKCGSDEKSSSFDSDEDLDTAIKDLLRSKRKLKKRSKDPRVHCKKKVISDDAERPVFDSHERDSKSQISPLLEKCLEGSRKNIKEGNVKKGPLGLVKGKPKGAKPVEFDSECKKEHQAKLVSWAEIQEVAKSPPGMCAVASLADGSSSVDSDDGIELEIQKFLAEKAKDGLTAGAFRGSGGVAEALGANKGQAAPSNECRLPRRGSSTLRKASKTTTPSDLSVPELSGSPRSERQTEGNTSPQCDHTGTSVDGTCSPAPVKSQAGPRTVQARGVGLRGKQAAVQTKAVYGKRLDQRTLSSGAGTAERYKWQTYFKPRTLFQRKSAYEFKISGPFLAGVRGGRKKDVLLGRRHSPAPLERQGVLSAADWFGEVSLPKEIVCSGSEAEQGPGFKAGSLHPSLQERRGNAQDEVANLAKSNPTKGPLSCQQVDFSQRLPLHELSPDEPRMVTVSAGITQIESPVREGGERQTSAIPWEKWQVPSSPWNLPLTKKTLVSQERRAEEQSKECVGESPAEFTHGGSAAECKLSLPKSKESGL